MGKVYRSFQGKEVDMERLMSQNETMPAVGNVRVNARGDELGPNGQIIRKREDILSEYYDSQPSVIDEEEISMAKVKIVSRRPVVEQPAPAIQETEAPITKTKSKEIK